MPVDSGPDPEPESPAEGALVSGRWRAALVVAGLAGAVVVALIYPARGPSGTDFPPYVGPPAASRVDLDDFLGARACAECHADEFADWVGSTHGRAGGEPSPELVLAAFDGTPIRFLDATVVPMIDPDGTYQFVVDWNGMVDTLAIEGVVGGGHMVGGGTQGFFARHDDGTVRFVPFDWSRHEQTWFCNTRYPERGEWRRITGEMSITECADWPPRRRLGQIEGGANCDTCHGSQIQAAFDPAAGAYETSYTGLEINCESCHGPGRAHVELVAAGGALTEANLGLEPLGTLDEDGSLEVCFRCHATRLVIRGGDLPGEPLQDNASLLLPLLTDRPFLPDNRVRTFAYQLNHKGSGCYLDGAMTCVSCHEPHTQTYQDEHGRTLVGRFDDGQCVGCHASKAERPEEHSFHERGSEGSLCVSCHMPFLQHPAVGDDIRYARSDHTIPIPRPGLDERLGVTSACAACHPETPPNELAVQLRAWYGEVKPWRPLVQGIASAPTTADPAAAADLLLRSQDGFGMAQASALSQYLLRFLRPDMPTLPPGVRQELLMLNRDSDVDVAALALAALHLSRGSDPPTRQLLVSALEARGERAYRVRDRWGAALRYVGDAYRIRGAYDDAVVAYRRSLEARPGEPRTAEGLGLALLAAGDGAASEEAFRSSVAADSTRASAWVNLAQALAQQGQDDEEAAVLTEAVRRFPLDPLPHFRLGNARLRRRDLLAAASAFTRSVELDGALASPRIGLAQILAAQGRLDEARRQVTLALQFEPDNPQAKQLLERLDQFESSSP
jgi:tetratricopeptide (TPR) repeat protein